MEKGGCGVLLDWMGVLLGSRHSFILSLDDIYALYDWKGQAGTGGKDRKCLIRRQNRAIEREEYSIENGHLPLKLSTDYTLPAVTFYLSA
jgi:hypothetical protein